MRTCKVQHSIQIIRVNKCQVKIYMRYSHAASFSSGFKVNNLLGLGTKVNKCEIKIGRGAHVNPHSTFIYAYNLD